MPPTNRTVRRKLESVGYDSRSLVGSRRDLVKIRGKWAYLYRAVDRAGKTIDFRLSARRDVAGAKVFFAKAIGTQDALLRRLRWTATRHLVGRSAR